MTDMQIKLDIDTSEAEKKLDDLYKKASRLKDIMIEIGGQWADDAP